MEKYGDFAVEIRESGDRYRLMQLKQGVSNTGSIEYLPVRDKQTGKSVWQEWVRQEDGAALSAAIARGMRGQLNGHEEQMTERSTAITSSTPPKEEDIR